MDFFLLTLVTGFLYVRPHDFTPELRGLPLYEITIVACLITSWYRLIPQFSQSSLVRTPTTSLVLLILPAAIISDLLHGQLEGATDFGIEFSKVVLYYLLIVSIVDTPSRLRWFLAVLVCFDLIPTTLALLQYHGMIDLPVFSAMEDGIQVSDVTGERTSTLRLHATGLFSDPNDVCQILNTALIFGFYWLLDRRVGVIRIIWVVPIFLVGQASLLTQSRGGFLAALCGLLVLIWSKYGTKKSMILGVVVLPVMFTIFGGRQTSLSTSTGTGQRRIELWYEGLCMLIQSPFTGIGTGQYAEHAGQVAHNGFIHAFTELGFFGGAFYFGLFGFALITLARLGSSKFKISDPRIAGIRPYILGALTSYAVSDFGLTHPYAVPTYGILALATTCIRQADPDSTLSYTRLSRKLFTRIFLVSIVFLVFMFYYVRYTVRWG